MNTEQELAYWRERTTFEEWFTKTKAYVSDPKHIIARVVKDIAWEAWQAARADRRSEPVKVNAVFETQVGEVIGKTEAEIKRVERQDDGSLTVVIDYWPQSSEPDEQHPDDVAVDAFAAAMKAKLAKKRSEGRDRWQECSAEYLSDLLRSHVEKGDPVDVANLAMMLHQNGQGITPAEPLKSQRIDDALRGLRASVAVGSDGAWVSIRREARDAAVKLLQELNTGSQGRARSACKTDLNNKLSSWSDEDFIRIFHERPDLANRLRKILAEPVRHKRLYAPGSALGEFGVIPMCDQYLEEMIGPVAPQSAEPVKSHLKVSYDDKGDCLYVACDSNETAHAEEDDKGILYRRAISDGRLVGITIMNFMGRRAESSDDTSQPAKPVKCAGCEGKPAPGNNPCAVCGKESEPVMVPPGYALIAEKYLEEMIGPELMEQLTKREL